MENKHLPYFLVSRSGATCVQRFIMKNEYFLQDSINMILVICLRVLRTKSEDLTNSKKQQKIYIIEKLYEIMRI